MGDSVAQRLIIVGYDRRFLSEDFAQATTEAVSDAGFDVLLAEDYAPTPALSWAVKTIWGTRSTGHHRQP